MTIPVDQAERERDHLIEKHVGETLAQRTTRLAYEEEFLKGNAQMAEKYLLEQVKANEGDARMLKDLAQFYLR